MTGNSRVMASRIIAAPVVHRGDTAPLSTSQISIRPRLTQTLFLPPRSLPQTMQFAPNQGSNCQYTLVSEPCSELGIVAFYLRPCYSSGPDDTLGHPAMLHCSPHKWARIRSFFAEGLDKFLPWFLLPGAPVTALLMNQFFPYSDPFESSSLPVFCGTLILLFSNYCCHRSAFGLGSNETVQGENCPTLWVEHQLVRVCQGSQEG